jgi:hypothetical protein
MANSRERGKMLSTDQVKPGTLPVAQCDRPGFNVIERFQQRFNLIKQQFAGRGKHRTAAFLYQQRHPSRSCNSARL